MNKLIVRVKQAREAIMDLDRIAGDYERDGVVRVEQLISPADVQDIRART